MLKCKWIKTDKSFDYWQNILNGDIVFQSLEYGNNKTNYFSVLNSVMHGR